MWFWIFAFCIFLHVNLGHTSRSGECPGNIRFYVHDGHGIGVPKFVVSENGKNEDGSYMFGDMYATEMVAIESFLNSPCRTESFLSADFFVVPVAPLRSGGMGWSNDGNVYMDFHGMQKLLDRIKTNIEQKFPNLWETKTHVFFVGHDYGACLASGPLAQQSIVVSPNGDYFSSSLKLKGYCSGVAEVMINASKKRAAAGHKMLGGDWDLGNSPEATCFILGGCYLPSNHVVIPPYIGSMEEIFDARVHFGIEKEIVELQDKVGHPYRNRTKRKTLLHFRGTVLDHEFYSICQERQIYRDIYGKLGYFQGWNLLYEEKMVDMKAYLKELAESIFCFAPSGWAGWSPRFVQAMIMGCVPVFVSCEKRVVTERPFHAHFDYNEFSVSISINTLKSGRLLHVLHNLISEMPENLVKKLDRINKVWKSFVITPQGGEAFHLLLQDIRTKLDGLRKYRINVDL